MLSRDHNNNRNGRLGFPVTLYDGGGPDDDQFSCLLVVLGRKDRVTEQAHVQLGHIMLRCLNGKVSHQTPRVPQHAEPEENQGRSCLL